MTFPDKRPGVRFEHETIAARASRQRRLELGQPCAGVVLDAWRYRLRMRCIAKMSPVERERYFS